MVKNMIKSGAQVTAFDIFDEACNLAKDEGAEISNSIGEVAIDKDFVLTMLPTTQDVVESRMGEEGIFANAKQGAVIVDSSTISPIESKKLGQKGHEKGFVVADAPVSGGIVGAAAGTLTFMLGCESSEYDNIKQYLDPMAGNVFNCGGWGTGQTAKICNNLCLAIEMIAVSEGLALGEHMGMDPKVLSNILSVSTARCWSVDTYNPRPDMMEGVPSSNNYNGGFGVSLMRKDLSLAMETANAAKLDIEFSDKALKYYKSIESKGMGKKDFSIVYQYINKNRSV